MPVNHSSSYSPEEIGKLIERAIKMVLDDQGTEADLTPLRWEISSIEQITIEGFHPEGRAHRDAISLCAAWASVLHLTQTSTSGQSYSLWDGHCGQFPVSLFAISDPAAYRREVPEDAELDL